jgi:hypothetical protein
MGERWRATVLPSLWSEGDAVEAGARRATFAASMAG